MIVTIKTKSIHIIKVIFYQKNLTKKKELTVPKNIKEKLKEKVHQNNKLHDFGFKNIKQTIKEPSKINIQQTSYQQTINLKQNLQENEHFGSIPRTYSKGSNRIDYILCSFNILTSITQCEMTAFGELVSSEHR